MSTVAKVDKRPIISIIVPVFNGEKTIRNCLEALVNQTYPAERYEIIVVDNGSYDNTVNIVEEFPVRLLFEKRAHNSYMARNLGIKQAKAEVIVFIDADCIAEKDWLANLVEPFHDENIGVVAGEVLSPEPKNLIQGFYTFSGFLEQEKKVKNKISAIGAGNTAIRKIIFDIIGQFDENFRWGGDNDFGVRIQKETTYLIRFAKKAIVYHFHRGSLKGLIKHAYTYGLGKGRFSMKYSGNKRLQNISEAFYVLLRFIAGISILPLHSYKIFASGKTISESLAYPILDKLFCIIEQIGKIVFLIKRDNVFFK
jgi:glycosyltransferase involved in cell wall biosynthesis